MAIPDAEILIYRIYNIMMEENLRKIKFFIVELSASNTNCQNYSIEPINTILYF
jgi:hypothetical protein